MRYRYIVALALVVVLSGCSKPEDSYVPGSEDAAVRAEAGLNTPTLPATTEGWPFDVPSDARASHRLLWVHNYKSGHIEALTRRDGPSDTSFARDEISCTSQTYRALGEGDTKDDALKDYLTLTKMSDLVSGSIADVTVQFACRKFLE